MNESDAMNAHDLIEKTARESYGRLVAYLVVSWRDLAAAEDALADAFVAALETWPRTGLPDRPEAWLLTAARRRLIDMARHARAHERIVPDLQAKSEMEEPWRSSVFSGEMDIPDERLKMLFICAHPEIDPVVRTSLMLQSVLGIDAARIASAFVVKPATMGQRLTRAKAKLRGDHTTFEMHDAAELPRRLDSVLEAIYAAYGIGWDEVVGVEARRKGLNEEAIHLGRLLAQFIPTDPEIQGLLALMLFCESRRDARRSETGGYIPLSVQDTALWSRSKIAEAEDCLHKAAQNGSIGRFQLMAAIQSVHAQRAWTGRTEWEAIVLLYEGLERVAPTIGTLVGKAAAVAEAYGPDCGLARLEGIPPAKIVNYQPYWALVAHLYTRMERFDQARDAYSRAVGLSTDPSVRAYLRRQIDLATGM